MRYGLLGGPNVGQFAAVAVDVPPDVGRFDRVSFRARAEQPMRISVQVRATMPGQPERWQRSIVLGQDDQTFTLAFDDMRPVGTGLPDHPPRPSIHNILFVVDTTNSKPGASGRIWLSAIELLRTEPEVRTEK